jgi:hypothetical protein
LVWPVLKNDILILHYIGGIIVIQSCNFEYDELFAFCRGSLGIYPSAWIL